MPKRPPFDSLEETALLMAQERNEAGCFIITQHHDGSYSFGTSGMSGDSVRYGLNHDNAVPLTTALLKPHSGHLAIYYSFIFEEQEHKGQEH